jgi:hypothetical protein
VACGTPEEIIDDHRVWRLVKNEEDALEWIADEQRWVPHSSPPSIQFNPDLSVRWAEHLEAVHSQTADDQLANDGSAYTLLFEAHVENLRQLNLSVTHSPMGPEPPDCSHASADYPPGLNRSERRAVRNAVSLSMALSAGVVGFDPPPNA